MTWAENGLLVSEAGPRPNSGRLSFVANSGARKTIVDGLPSSAVPGSNSGPTAVLLRDGILYIAIGEGDTLITGTVPGTQLPNPRGPASALFSSILRVTLPGTLASLNGEFVLTPANQASLADGAEITLSNGAGATAKADVLANFADFRPDPNTIARASNPFSMAWDPSDDRSIVVADAGQNALFRVNADTGRWRVLTRFGPVPNEGQAPPPVVDAVPTSVRAYGDALLVTFLTGFPFAPGAARVVAVDPRSGAQGPFINGLSAVSDLAYRDAPSGGEFYTLEFSTNMLAGAPGRLRRYRTPAGEDIRGGLITASAMAQDPATGDIYIAQLGPGLIVRVRVP